MKIGEIISALERFAPLPLQDDFDNSGLQVGTTQAEVSGALLCLDVTLDVVREAANLGCNLIVSHHPLLFHPLKKVVDSDFSGAIVMEAVKNGITLYASHTNLDNAFKGVNMRIAQTLGLTACKPLQDNGDGNGAGLVGELQDAVDEQVMLTLIKHKFNTPCIRHNAPLDKKIKRVAVCGGSGSFLIDKALSIEADAFLTGEISYHRFFGYDGRIKLIEAGHFETEQYTVQLLHDILKSACPDLRVFETQCKTNPVNYFI